jgi:cytochrome P450
MSIAFEFDPFDPICFDDPYPAYRILRNEHPTYRREIEKPQFFPHYWMLSRAADVDDALRDWQTFSSAKGTLIDTDISLIPPNMFNMDPPRHDELRAILARVLTPARVAELERSLRGSASELIAGVRDLGTFDAATEYAQLIPTLTMCELMDLPTSDRGQFLKWNLDTLADGDFTGPVALKAYADMGDYWKGLVAERRRRHGPDLISQILQHQSEGQPLSDAEIAGFCSLLLDASQNTTMNTITNGILSLARFPDERSKVALDPGRWASALEELLRFVSPVQGLARATTRDVTLHDVTIPAGDPVLVLYGSANHDETVYADPDSLDFERDARGHWAFGRGIHTCLGNAVARLEVRVALEELLAAIPEYDYDDSRIERNQLVPTRGIAHAPIEFRSHR